MENSGAGEGLEDGLSPPFSIGLHVFIALEFLCCLETPIFDKTVGSSHLIEMGLCSQMQYFFHVPFVF